MKSTIQSSKQTKWRITGLVITFALIIVGLMAISVYADDTTTWLDISKGDIEIGDGTVSGYDVNGNAVTVANTDGYTITGDSSEYSVQITGGTHSIILNQANICFTDGSGEGGSLESKDDADVGTAAFEITGGTVVLTVVGESTLQSGVGRAGLEVASGAALIVNGDGALTAIGGDGGAGIGGNSFSNAGAITISSGYICAIGNGGGAAIGGGHSNNEIEQRRQTNLYGSFVSIAINGGTIVAQSNGEATAIGTGYGARSSGSISISDALVVAETDGNCASIGAYNQNVTSNISIIDSIVIARNSESNTSSIGETVTASSSIVVADNDTYTQGSPVIGSNVVLPQGYILTVGEEYSVTMEEGYSLTNNGALINSGTVSSTEAIINNGTITNFGTIDGTLLNNGSITNVGTIGEVLAASTGELSEVSTTECVYLDGNGQEQICTKFTIISPSLVSWNEGWYVMVGTIELDSRVTLNGNVHLILVDGSSLTVNGGIDVDSADSFTVYAQSTNENMGKLTVQNIGDHYAGIGAGTGNAYTTEASGAITVNGGEITATGGRQSAGVGGSGSGETGAIIMNGGKLTAIGGENGAGIGGGNGGTAVSITINGGVVEAVGGSNGAGIGSANGGVANNITINAGAVKATGGASSAGIGSGNNGIVNTIFINNGAVEAQGGSNGAGLGSGNNGALNTCIINNGTVSSVGGANGAGIGSGTNGTVATVIVNNGNVTALGGTNGAGIGGGSNGNGGNVTISDGYVTAIAGDTNSGITAYGIGAGAGYRGNTNTVFSTTSTGSAVIKASSISNKETSGWSGIVFEGENGVVYGVQTLVENYTVENGEVLIVGDDSSLIVSEGVSLINNGTIVVYGTVTINGTLEGTGRIAYPLESVMSNVYSSNNMTYAYTDADYSTELSVNDGWLLPLAITVTLNGNTLEEGIHYTYSRETGKLVIFKENITGKIVILANGAKIYDVWLGAVQITDLNKENVLAGTENDGMVSYDPQTDMLTINGINLSGDTKANSGSAIYSESDLCLTIAGENTLIAVDVEDKESAAVTIKGNLIINGKGTLTAIGGSGAEISAGINVFGLEITDARVISKGGAGMASSTGVRAIRNNIIVNSGSLTAEGVESNASYGIIAVTIEIKDGTVSAFGYTRSIDALRVSIEPLLNHLVHVSVGDGNVIEEIAESPYAINTDVTTISNSSQHTLIESKVIKNIVAITKTASNTETLEDTYTIFYTDGSTDQFVVTNGKIGEAPQVRINEETNKWEVSYDSGQSWTSLGVNATGEKGADGKDGIDGTNGVDGKDGIDGTNGIDGKDGINGINGVDGGVGLAIASTIVSSISIVMSVVVLAWLLLKRKR